MISRKIEEAQARSKALKKEHDALVSELAKKKAEIDGLATGYDKYKDNRAMQAQLEEVMKKRMEELTSIISRIDDLGRDIKRVNEELNRLSEETRHQLKTRVVKEFPAVRIATTPMVDKMISSAMKRPTDQGLAIPAVKSQPAPQPQKSEVKKEEPQKEAGIKAEPGPKKAKPSKDLYDRAAEEARAQEEYLKKMGGGRKDYGAA